MIYPKTFVSISILISLLLCPCQVWSQSNGSTSGTQPDAERQRGIQFEGKTQEASPDSLHLIHGFSVGFDGVGLIMYGVANYGQIEAMARLNLKEKIFPTLEIGLGHSNHTDDATSLHFATDAPYIRIGCDYNFNKDILSRNRIFGGLRYGYTNFKYDIDGPDMTDPVWGDVAPYHFTHLKGKASWIELVFGLEAKIWRDLHIGWTARYRRRISQTKDDIGQAWYIPGFGKNDSHNFGATFNIIFDI